MDSGGTSDPYAIFLIDNEEIFRSKEVKKDLNPIWNETCQILLNELQVSFKIQIYDKDILRKDDFMGEAFIQLNKLQTNRPEIFQLELNPGTNKTLRKMVSKQQLHLGYIEVLPNLETISKSEYQTMMSVERVRPKTLAMERGRSNKHRRSSKPVGDGSLIVVPSHGQYGPSHSMGYIPNHSGNYGPSMDSQWLSNGMSTNDDFHEIISVREFHPTESNGDIKKRRKSYGNNVMFTVKVHVLIVQAMGLPPMDNGINSDPYCKVSLGKEKHRTNIVKESMNPKWREEFTFNWQPGSRIDELKIEVWDKDVSKDDFIGRYRFLNAK